MALEASVVAFLPHRTTLWWAVWMDGPLWKAVHQEFFELESEMEPFKSDFVLLFDLVWL